MVTLPLQQPLHCRMIAVPLRCCLQAVRLLRGCRLRYATTRGSKPPWRHYQQSSHQRQQRQPAAAAARSSSRSSSRSACPGHQQHQQQQQQQQQQQGPGRTAAAARASMDSKKRPQAMDMNWQVSHPQPAIPRCCQRERPVRPPARGMR